MAARIGHDVQERRLKAIYDALDSGNTKKAIYEADKVLKKDPSSHTAKALKGLALHRSGRTLDAASQIESLCDEVPTQETTLNALTFYFRESGQADKMSTLLEAACKRCPDREDLLSNLFYAYVRRLDYQAQQTTARQLHKLAPNKNQYFYWMVMSTVMQSDSNPALARKMYLPLAEKMLKKHLEEGKVETDSELSLYIYVLEKLSKWEEARDVLTSDVLSKLTKNDELTDVSVTLMNYEEKLNNPEEVCRVALKMVEKNPDDWTPWNKFIGTVFHLNRHDTEEYSLPSALNLILSYTKTRNLRGPFVALMTFTHFLVERGLASESGLDFVVTQSREHFVAFYKRFGHKQASAYDLSRSLLTLFPKKEDQHQIVRSLLEDQSEPCFPTLGDMQRRMLVEQLSRCCGLHWEGTAAEKMARVNYLCACWKDGFKFAEGLQPTDLHPSDSFLILAASLLHDMWRDGEDDSRLILAIILLEHCLKLSPSCHHAKIRLMRLYGMLGCLRASMTFFEALDVKQIMLDSMGYLAMEQSTRLGQYSVGISLSIQLNKLEKTSLREVEDCLACAYKNTAYCKAAEFVLFHRRIKNGFQFHNAKLEFQVLHLLLSPNTFDQLIDEILEFQLDPNEEANFSEVVDGRDFDASISFDPPEILFTPKDQKLSFADEKRWLVLRHLSCRSLLVGAKLYLDGTERLDRRLQTGASEIEARPREDGRPEMTDLAQVLLKKLEDLRTETPECEYTVKTIFGLTGPNPARTSLYVHGPFGDVLRGGLQVSLYLRKVAESDAARDPEFESSMESLLVAPLDQAVVSMVTSGCQLSADVLTRLCMLAETLALAVLWLAAAHSLFRPVRLVQQQSKRRGKKKKREPLTNGQVLPGVSEVMVRVSDCVVQLVRVAEDLSGRLAEMSSALVMEGLRCEVEKSLKLSEVDVEDWMGSDATATKELVAERILQSYRLSIDELTQLVKDKQRAASALVDPPNPQAGDANVTPVSSNQNEPKAVVLNQ